MIGCEHDKRGPDPPPLIDLSFEPRHPTHESRLGIGGCNRSPPLQRTGKRGGIKQGVILPILRALGWNFGSIKPEHTANRGCVDYALLCHGRPQIFIEAKRRGVLDVRAEEQLFGYASNQGVPLLVLTDGDHWDFFLSMADGLPEDRRSCRLKLFHEDEIPQYMEFLETYLRKHRVASGEARRSAETCLGRKSTPMREVWEQHFAPPPSREETIAIGFRIAAY